jgi:CubicO group peptidase (beta-lactamase class C family)
MKRIIKRSILSIFILSICWNCNPKNENEKKAGKSEKIDSLIATLPDFSGVVLIANSGNPIYYKAFGYRNFETETKLDSTDVFELASVSKQFTAMVIMMLKEEKRLELDDSLEKYITGLPYPGITIRHLLTHTSGLPDYQAIMDEHWNKANVAGNDDIIEYLKKYQPPSLFAPGEKYEYSNTGYVLLGTIAERASGKDFIALCRERIFNPLQMTHTDIRTIEEKKLVNNFAIGHIYVAENQRYIRADSFPSSDYTIWLGNRKGPGRISSTAGDLLKWDQALYTEKIISKTALKEVFTPYLLNNDSLSYYGFGWMLDEHDNNFVYHTGSNPGYSTQITRFMDDNKTIIVLCNNAHAEFHNLLKSLKKIVSEE